MGISLRRSGPGWRADVRHGGRRCSVTAPTRAEAATAGAELLIDMGATPSLASSLVTFADVLAAHIAASTAGWSPQYAADCSRLAARIPTDVAARPAAEVASADIAALYRRLERAGWSAHRLQRLHGLVSGSFRRAAISGWVRGNPSEGTSPPPPGKASLVIPTAAQVAALVAAAAPGLEQLFVRVAAITGARRGELVALQWSDVAAGRGEVVIRRARSTDEHGRPYSHDGKTGRRGHRVLSIDPATVARLVDRHRSQLELAAARLLPAPTWIFSEDAGVTPWTPDRGTDVFTAARLAAGVPGVRLHDLRHYVATSMLQDGESPIDVAAQLGDTVQTVLRTYAHFLPGRGRDAVLRRASLLA